MFVVAILTLVPTLGAVKFAERSASAPVTPFISELNNSKVVSTFAAA